MLDTLGPMTRTVRDAAILFDVIADYSEGTSEPSDVDATQAFKGLRIGVPENLGVTLHPDTELVWKKTQALIKACGGDLVPIRFPTSLADYAAPCGMFLAVDGYRHYGVFAEEEPNRIGNSEKGHQDHVQDHDDDALVLSPAGSPFRRMVCL